MFLVCCLTVVASSVSLVRLVKCFKPEEIDSPVKHGTNRRFPICLHIAIASFRITGIACAGSRPARFCRVSYNSPSLSREGLTSVHEVDLVKTAGNFLDVCKSLRHIIKVCLGSVTDILELPISKMIGET